MYKDLHGYFYSCWELDTQHKHEYISTSISSTSMILAHYDIVQTTY